MFFLAKITKTESRTKETSLFFMPRCILSYGKITKISVKWAKSKILAFPKMRNLSKTSPYHKNQITCQLINSLTYQLINFFIKIVPKMLIMVINHNFYRCFSCRLKENAYLCTVFFIVLDLRLTKVGVRRYSIFLCQKKRVHPTGLTLYIL